MALRDSDSRAAGASDDAHREPRTDARAALQALVARATQGDEQSFADLHVAMQDFLAHFFHRRGGADSSAARVEELIQQTWIELWRALQRGAYSAERAAFTTFAYGVATKIWLRHRRASGAESDERAALKELADDVAWHPIAVEEDPSAVLEFAAQLDALRACLASAEREHRLLAIEAKIARGLLSGVTERELARELGVAPSTIHARKQSLLAKLRRCLASKGHEG
ncbi:MAG: RNA polymerase sigma factor [Planctomycetota bacterium]